MNDAVNIPPSPVDTVLVVENEVLVRTVIAEYLRDCGYKVIEAASADEAIVVLTEPGMQVDIVFSDVQMPGSMDGFGLSKWIREHRKGLQIVLTSTAENAAEAAGDLCEDGPYLKKPYESSQVFDWIKRLRATSTR